MDGGEFTIWQCGSQFRVRLFTIKRAPIIMLWFWRKPMHMAFVWEDNPILPMSLSFRTRWHLSRQACLDEIHVKLERECRKRNDVTST